jgi:hypothetical protein
MVPSFYQTVDTGIISLIKPAPDFHNHPFSSYFFVFSEIPPYAYILPLNPPGGTLKFVSFLKPPLGGLGVKTRRER